LFFDGGKVCKCPDLISSGIGFAPTQLLIIYKTNFKRCFKYKRSYKCKHYKLYYVQNYISTKRGSKQLLKLLLFIQNFVRTLSSINMIFFKEIKHFSLYNIKKFFFSISVFTNLCFGSVLYTLCNFYLNCILFECKAGIKSNELGILCEILLLDAPWQPSRLFEISHLFMTVK
jgi:hypothetical protein